MSQLSFCVVVALWSLRCLLAFNYCTRQCFGCIRSLEIWGRWLPRWPFLEACHFLLVCLGCGVSYFSSPSF